MSTIVVPDSITPYYGYKWLRVWHNYLYSPAFEASWPVGRPLEAVCQQDFGYRLVMRPYGEAFQPVEWDSEFEETRSMSSNQVVVEVRTTVKVKTPQGTLEQITTNEAYVPPSIVLPPGMVWSFEPRPCPHEPVAEDCHCGIYVVANPRQADNYRGYGQANVLVRVALWGRVIEGDRGARGQYAYPVEVILSRGSKKGVKSGVRAAYGLPGPRPSVESRTVKKQFERDEAQFYRWGYRFKQKHAWWPGWDPGDVLFASAMGLLGVCVVLMLFALAVGLVAV